MAKAKIQTVAQTEKAGLFSICFEGESFTEFQKFITKFQDDVLHSEELNVILRAIQHMIEGAGFLERYFRPEGKMNDHVCAVPIETSHLRLYCLRLSDSVLIAGNGGVKNTRRYQDCPELAGYVISLQKLDEAIKIAVKKGNITIEEASIENINNTQFDI